jgi:peptide deformylase
MSILKVARMGHPVLRARAAAVDLADLRSPALQRLIDDMIETMHEYQGVGLAAPQVHERLRLFVAAVGEAGDEPNPTAPVLVVVNPVVQPIGTTVIEDWEGCLSVPDVRGRVPRAQQVRLTGYDRRGEPLAMRASDFAARVIQHEADHLDGVLFLDRMRSLESLTFLEEYARFWDKPHA